MTAGIIKTLLDQMGDKNTIRVEFRFGMIEIFNGSKRIKTYRYRWWNPMDRGKAIRDTCKFLITQWPSAERTSV